MEFADVFLSHHVSSMNSYASKLDEELQAAGIKTFICTSMMPGDDFRQNIIVNAVKCKIFVAFVNEAWAKSEECVTEFNCALRGFNSNKSPKIIPIIIGGFGWIDVVKYPDVFNITANTNCAVADGNNWGKVFQQVITSIKNSLEINTPTAEIKGIPEKKSAAQESTDSNVPEEEIKERGKFMFRSWKGDYLHRPDTSSGVTFWHTGVGNEWVIEEVGDKIRFRSWKGDYLQRCESGQGVTTTHRAGPLCDWTVVTLGNSRKFKSCKGDYLNRQESSQAITTESSGHGNEWTVEVIHGEF